MDLLVRHERSSRVDQPDVVHLSGDVDLATIPRLADALIKAVDSSTGTTPLVVDLDGVVVLDDAALGLLLGAAGRLRTAGRDLVVACTTPTLRHRLARTGFERAVRVIDRISAVGATGQPPLDA